MSSSNRILRIETAEAFADMFGNHRYQGLSGGRGSAKSHFFGSQLVEESIMGHVRAACVREVQNSIKDSVKQLIEDYIAAYQVSHLFKITEREIVGPNESLFIFRGLKNHTAASIKSLEGFNRAWFEEAQTLSQRSLDLALPTFRSGSQMRFSWNCDEPTDPVDVLFSSNKGDPDFIHRHVDYRDNPWFPDELRRDMERDRRRDIDKFNHVWLGKHQKNSEARVFKNWEVHAFDVPADVMYLHGADWGYSVDPTVLLRCFTGRWSNGVPVYDPNGLILFISHECYKIGVEIDDTPRFFDGLDPDNTGSARTWPIIADSASPQSISYLKRHGYPLIQPSRKGPGSIREGIKFLQGYDIIVHPRCRHVQDELQHFCFKIDPKTTLVTNELMETKNHVIDSLRYAVEPVRKPSRKPLIGSY